MLYIVTALKSEAQAFVDKYRLGKKRVDAFTIFQNENITLIVSGIGVERSRSATEFLIKKFALKSRDIFINVGICGACKTHEIGRLLKIGSIIYKERNYILDRNAVCSITCVDEEMSEHLHDIADMESFGFYEATKEIKNRHIYKVVSDHFEPDMVTKDGTKKLILNAIDTIVKEVTK
ncbi:MAG: hypothetical protein C0627_07375 [Sulfurimonas sp.]|nr:MAG: hypothetical protein C0627_07375 [Sulfurimonas sp.]